jgi:sugar-phosphatase
MDGTILTSTAASERAWTTWALRHNVDLPSFLPTIHGVQAIESIRRLGRQDLDAALEADIVTQLELEDVGGVERVRGAVEFLAAVPADRWALVTSAPLALASRRMMAAGFPLPAVMVTAEAVARSKPAPDGFLLAASRLGVPVAECLIFEDSEAGIAAAEATSGTIVRINTRPQAAADSDHLTLRDFAGLSVTMGQDNRLAIALGAEDGLTTR